MSNAMDSLLRKTYYDINNPGGYRGVNRLVKATNINKKKVKQFLSGEDTYTLHKPPRKRFPRRRVVVGGIKQQIQVDLVDMQRLKKYNNGISFLLVAIDPFSKFARVYPLKNKTADSVLKAFKSLFREKNTYYQCLFDRGQEFYNNKIQRFLKERGIKSVASKNEDVKMSIVERFNRTLKTIIFRYMTKHNTYRYIDVLHKIVKTYNNTYHRSIGMSPKDVTYSNQEDVWDNMYDIANENRNNGKRLQVNDRVRISRIKNIFEKGYTPSWSREIFTIHKVHSDISPVVYTIKDYHGEIIDGSFYTQELQKVKDSQIYQISKIIKTRTRRGVKEYLVSWLGWDDSFNSYVKASDIVKYRN